MTNGYTAALYAGEQSFEDFALDCLRLSRVRPDGPVKMPVFRTDYQEQLSESLQEVEQLKNLPREEIEAAAKNQYEADTHIAAQVTAQHEALRERYEAMLDKVQRWTPSPALDDTKNFMVKQLRDALRFDYAPTSLSVPMRLTPEEWHLAAVARAQRRHTRLVEDAAKEAAENAAARTQVIEFVQSLGLTYEE